MILRPTTRFRWRALGYCFLLLLFSSVTHARKLQAVIVGGFLSTQDCFEALVNSDGNGDGEITAAEYVSFAADFTDSPLVNAFSDLPAAFIATFNRLAWDCSACEADDVACCEQVNGVLQVPETIADVSYDLCISTLDAASATLSPTAIPTVVPTSVAPTLVPTVAPAAIPTTVAPANVPAPVTTAPTPQPVAAPTFVETVSLSYSVAIRDGSNQLENDDFVNEYRANLRNAIDDIVQGVIQRRRRQLQELVSTTRLETEILDSCPDNLQGYTMEENDVCEEIQHDIIVSVESDAQAEAFETEAKAALERDLQQFLDDAPWSVVDSNPITVLSFLDTNARALGGGAIGGITAGALLLALIPAAYLLYRKKKNDDKKDYQDPEDIEEMGESLDEMEEPLVEPASGPTLTLGATLPDYGKNDVLAEPGLLDNDDTSSNAGSSGWSSSAGISSLNTGSMDEEGATLAGIGVASAFSRNLRDDNEDSDTPSRDQLDALIESGDWAAVGATAALLAAASDSQSERSSKADSTSGDNNQAAELDELVDAGDWEGVVAAAAKFESSAGTGSQSRTTTNSMESTGTGQSTLSNSIGDTPSKVQKREEVRAEVEALVRRVVPEEIDNVDEMMNQFKGREEELVETLRTMQERAVAQKARSAGHKAAKQEARRNVKRGAAAPAGKGTVKEAAAAGTGGVSKAGATNLKDNIKDNPRSALEEAIEAGDWEAVGEAAAMISDSSVTTADTAEIQRLAGTNLSISTSGSRSNRSNMSGIQADRAAELDQLIDSGDWTAVMAAAKGFSDTDRKDASAGNRSKEEEEALKEAEHWMKIAEKTKGSNSGASDAAAWAIQRSLNELKKAEKKSEDKSGEDEV